MRRAEQSVEDEDIDPTKSAHRIFRQLLRVGDVPKVANAVTINGDRAVRNGHWRDLHVSDAKALPRKNGVRSTLGFARPGKCVDGVVEDVREALRQSGHRIRRSVHLDRTIAPVGKRADVVDSMDVIRVIMCE